MGKNAVVVKILGFSKENGFMRAPPIREFAPYFKGMSYLVRISKRSVL